MERNKGDQNQGEAAKILWAPWRMSYIQRQKPVACIFCAADRDEADADQLVLCRAEHVFVMMNRYPYAYGHILISSRRHVGGLEELSARELLDLISMTRDSVDILRRCLNPDGFNVGLNLGKVAGAGYADHLHIHVVPRWQGDTNFMPLVAETRVISEHLGRTYQKLREAYDQLESMTKHS